jgi:hypothetical protein
MGGNDLQIKYRNTTFIANEDDSNEKNMDITNGENGIYLEWCVGGCLFSCL